MREGFIARREVRERGFRCQKMDQPAEHRGEHSKSLPSRAAGLHVEERGIGEGESLQRAVMPRCQAPEFLESWRAGLA